MWETRPTVLESLPADEILRVIGIALASVLRVLRIGAERAAAAGECAPHKHQLRSTNGEIRNPDQSPQDFSAMKHRFRMTLSGPVDCAMAG